MSENALLHQVLTEIGALRGEVADLRAQLTGQGKEGGLWESARNLTREVADLRDEITAMQATIAAQEVTIGALQNAPGRVAVRWAEVVLLGVTVSVVASVIVGIGGVVWMHFQTPTQAFYTPSVVTPPHGHPHRGI